MSQVDADHVGLALDSFLLGRNKTFPLTKRFP